jgi:hypothetical protein
MTCNHPLSYYKKNMKQNVFLLNINELYNYIDDIDNKEFIEAHRCAALQKNLIYNYLALSIAQCVEY